MNEICLSCSRNLGADIWGDVRCMGGYKQPLIGLTCYRKKPAAIKKNIPRGEDFGDDCIMRDIFFCGRKTDNARIVFGFIIYKNGDFYIINPEDFGQWDLVKPDSVERFTGHRDADGRRIFVKLRILK